MLPDLTRAGLDTRNKQIHFYHYLIAIHQLTADDSYCPLFFSLLSSWLVWCPEVHGCSLNSSSGKWELASSQVAEISNMIDIGVRN